MDSKKTMEFVDRFWNDTIMPSLAEYIRIPCKSPFFDAGWQEHGYMEQAFRLVEKWCGAQPIAGMKLEIIRLKGRTPVLFIDIPGEGKDCILLYGHLDKQPEMTGWREGLGPWTPVIEEGRLFGRGGADDGYAVYASLAAVLALKQQEVRHARCIVLIEGCEESGSYDLPAYIEALADRIGVPGLIVCLDSGCGDYDQLWNTTSLRGLAAGDLTVELLKEGVHSGDGSGIVASSFRVIRALLSRLEDEKTGAILPREFHVEISRQRRAQAEQTANILGEQVYSKMPMHDGVRPVTRDVAELILNRTMRPALAVTGAAGLPALQDAGNVLRPMTALKVSLRLPPGLDAGTAGERLKALFETDPPYGARVRFDPVQCASGWSAPDLSPWLAESMDRASEAFFGAKAACMGEGGSIPFMDMLGKRFPAAQYLITGVLGPNSNAHGPNEFLDIPTGKKVTCCVAHVLADHFRAVMRA